MLVSTRGRYGMRMMIDIARHQGQGRVALREIGERQGISVKYLEQLARALCAAGLQPRPGRRLCPGKVG